MSSFLIYLFLTDMVCLQLGCKFFLYFSLLVYPYNDPPFTPLTPNLPYQGSRGSLGNKLRNVKFRTLTLRQSKLNNVDDQRIIFLLFRINLPTFLILGFGVMKVKRVKATRFRISENPVSAPIKLVILRLPAIMYIHTTDRYLDHRIPYDTQWLQRGTI